MSCVRGQRTADGRRCPDRGRRCITAADYDAAAEHRPVSEHTSAICHTPSPTAQGRPAVGGGGGGGGPETAAAEAAAVTVGMAAGAAEETG